MNAKDIVTALTPLANKLGQGGEEVYRQYLRQAIVNGLQDLIVSAILTVFIIFVASKFIRPMYAHYKEDDYNVGIALGLSVVGLFLVGFFVMYCLNDALTSFANPGYWATSNLIQAVQAKP